MFDIAPFPWQVTTSVAANRFGLPWFGLVPLLQIGKDHLGLQPAVGKHDGLKLARQEFVGQSGRFFDVAAADAEIAIDHRRIVKNEKLLAGWGTVFLDNFDLLLDQLRRQFPRIRNRRRAADELRIRAVEAGDALQSPQHVGKMTAEDSPRSEE